MASLVSLAAIALIVTLANKASRFDAKASSFRRMVDRLEPTPVVITVQAKSRLVGTSPPFPKETKTFLFPECECS